LCKVIAIGGPHGTGKSTYAKAIASEFGLRLSSAGKLFREIAEGRGLSLEEMSEIAKRDPSIDEEIDGLTKREVERGSVVVEGQLVAWMAGDGADMKIYLFAPDELRFKRIAERDRLDIERAKEQTRIREAAQKERYFRLYGIDAGDLSVYDLLVDTSLLPLEETARFLTKAVEAFVGQCKRGRKNF
jgi:cytidylate kinase